MITKNLWWNCLYIKFKSMRLLGYFDITKNIRK